MTDFVNHLQEEQIAEAIENKKTNENWYPFETLGAYFKIDTGSLLGCAMNSNGTREDNPFVVDWYRIDEEEKQALKAAFQVLIGQP